MLFHAFLERFEIEAEFAQLLGGTFRQHLVGGQTAEQIAPGVVAWRRRVVVAVVRCGGKSLLARELVLGAEIPLGTYTARIHAGQ